MLFYTYKSKILLCPSGGSQHDKHMSEGSTGAGGKTHRIPIPGRYFFHTF